MKDNRECTPHRMFEVHIKEDILRVVGNDKFWIRILYAVAFLPCIIGVLFMQPNIKYWFSAIFWISAWLAGIWLADERLDFVFDRRVNRLRWTRKRPITRAITGQIPLSDIMRAELRESTRYRGAARWRVVLITRSGDGTGSLPLTSSYTLNGDGELTRVALAINDFLKGKSVISQSLQHGEPDRPHPELMR